VSDAFESHRSYWWFRDSVNASRYFRSETDQKFLNTLYELSWQRWETVPAGAYLYRAQTGHDWRSHDLDDFGEDGSSFPCAHPPERMKPLPDRASEGRANPKGAPILYTATEAQTAVAEVRPWVGAYVSVAVLELQRDVTVVNCTEDDQRIVIYRDDAQIKPEERAKQVWRDIDRAFAQPYDPADQTVAAYAPTQVIAEFFRGKGLEGIAYRSAMGGAGHNLALYDPSVAEVVKCDLVQIKAVRFDYLEVDNPYYIASKRKRNSEAGPGK
jgi:RES domain-containing protein